jgi:hypothetical protein
VARACVGAKLRTEPSLDNTKENVASWRVIGEYLKDITHGEERSILKMFNIEIKWRKNN